MDYTDYKHGRIAAIGEDHKGELCRIDQRRDVCTEIAIFLCVLGENSAASALKIVLLTQRTQSFSQRPQRRILCYDGPPSEFMQSELQLIENEGSFERDGYLVARKVFDRQHLDIYASYSLMLDINSFRRREEKPGMRDRYGDPLMESILLHLQPTMEKFTGLSLLPTYSYLRVYEAGASLHRHKDRHACEISASVTLGYEAAEPWPLWLEIHQQPRSITLHRGDMVVYKGRDLEHWRERFDGNYWIQAFFHYVDANGPLASYKFDGRRGIGFPPE